MTLLKCSSIIVSDVRAASERYALWLDYQMVEEGVLTEAQAKAFDAPASAGAPYVILAPASGNPVFIRLIEALPVEGYRPIHSYGWAATEICIQDVEAVHERMKESPFEVIGPPRTLDGYPNVKPMQVRGPDQEILYLTEFSENVPGDGLPVPKGFIDRPFILVLACENLAATCDWISEVFGFWMTPPMAINYTMIAKSFGLPMDSKHEIVTAKAEDEFFLEFDQYPEGAEKRPSRAGELPPGVAICTIEFGDFTRLESHWFSAPEVRQGPFYKGRRVGVLKSPEGILFEVIERASA